KGREGRGPAAGRPGAGRGRPPLRPPLRARRRRAPPASGRRHAGAPAPRGRVPRPRRSRPRVPRGDRATGARAGTRRLRPQSLRPLAAVQLRDRGVMSAKPLDTRALLDEADASLLDLVDNVLTKGVVIDGE